MSPHGTLPISASATLREYGFEMLARIVDELGASSRSPLLEWFAAAIEMSDPPDSPETRRVALALRRAAELFELAAPGVHGHHRANPGREVGGSAQRRSSGADHWSATPDGARPAPSSGDEP